MAILPAGYQQVEYIQSSGTQYIDTGVSAPNGFKAIFGVTAVESASASRTVVGSHNISSPYGRNNVNMFTSGNTWGLHMNDEMINGLGNIVIGTKYEVECSTILGASYLKVDGVNLTNGSNTSPMSSNNVLIFANQYEINAGTTFIKAKIYYCKIYDNSETLVRDLVPCYRKSDGIIGLYDVVNSQFYTNSGTGTFVKGPDKVLKVKAVYLGNYRLPSEYQEVEYIQSSGTQYIDTGWTPSSNYARVVAQIEPTLSGQQWEVFYGMTNGSNHYSLHTNKDTLKWYINVGSNGNIITNIAFSSGTKVNTEFEANNGAYSVNVNGTTYSGTYSGTVVQSTRNMYIFAYNENGSTTWKQNMKLYSFKIYSDASTLVRDFVPCYRKADNVIGLYDLVNDTFYTNAGTGTFTKGENVKPYIKIRPKESGGTLSGYWDYTTTSQATLQAEGWGGQGGGSWSVSGSGLTTSRSTTDRSYMVSLPIQINTKAKSIRIYGVINRTVGSWYGSFSWGIKATNTCGSGRDDYPADDWLINQSVNCNNNSGYMGYGAGSSGSVLNCGLPGWDANLGYSGSDLAVETIIDIENGEISATWKSGNTTVQSGTATFDIATVKSLLSAVSTNQYLSIFTRNGTGNGKTMKNFGYEIIY